MPRVVPDQGSGGRVTPVVKNYYEHRVYNSVKYSIVAAIGLSASLGGYVLSKDPYTSMLSGSVGGAIASAVVDSIQPDYTSTYFISSYSSYYKKTIYKQVVYIYRNPGRTDLYKIKVSAPLEKINSAFRALR